MKFKKLYLTMLLLPSIAIGASTKGIKYIDGSGPTNPAAMVCANSSTPLPIVISTLRDFGITSIYKNRVLVTIEAIYWTEKERGVPLKFASFFGDTEVNWPGKPSFGDGSSGHSVSQIPLSARFMNGMSVADAGLGGTSKLDHKRKFEPYYSQVEYLKSRYFYIIKYRPGVQFGEYGVRQPDEIIWLPTRSIKSLKIKVEDKNSPPRPEISNITAFVAFTWTAKSGYNPKSMDPPILELSNVEMSGWDKENGGNYSTAVDPDLHVQYLANLSAKVSMSLGEKYTLAANWSRIPDIRNLVENTNYSKQYRVARDAFGALNVNFPSLFHGIERGEKFPGYDLNLRKVDFIYANLDLIENNLHEFGYKNYVQTYFRGSINAYNNVYIDEDQYRRDGSVLDICN